MMQLARLGVNIDHVATIREARKTLYPCLSKAAEISLKSGADQITIHLRADRRHIQDQDVPEIINFCHGKNSFLNLEICCDPSIVNQATYYRPDWVCLVPERVEERTTEGGLNLKDPLVMMAVEQAILKFKKHSPLTKISLFLAPDIALVPLIKKLSIDAVEVHTGDYAHKFPHHQEELLKIKNFLQALASSDIGLHAGHGLTNDSIVPLLELNLIEEYNIGHWIIAESIFIGLENVVRNLRNLIAKYPLKS